MRVQAARLLLPWLAGPTALALLVSSRINNPLVNNPTPRAIRDGIATYALALALLALTAAICTILTLRLKTWSDPVREPSLLFESVGLSAALALALLGFGSVSDFYWSGLAFLGGAISAPFFIAKTVAAIRESHLRHLVPRYLLTSLFASAVASLVGYGIVFLE